MNLIATILAAAITLGLCYLTDRYFTRAFRSKQQHHSGMAVRFSKRYGIFSVAMIALGVLSICVGLRDALALLLGGIMVLIMGICLAIYYLSHGIFYDGDTFLVSAFRKQDKVYRYQDIRTQKLYLVQGGSIIIELHMKDGTAVSLQSTMDGVYLFLDAAFAGWCLQQDIDPESCDFHDPANSVWFPQSEEDT